MFAPYCEAHGSRVLLPTTSITNLVPTSHGMTAFFVCRCGEPGVWSPPERRAD